MKVYVLCKNYYDDSTMIRAYLNKERAEYICKNIMN